MPDNTLFDVSRLPGIIDKIVTSGISQTDALSLVGDLLQFNAGALQRIFNYLTAFPAADPDCVAQFNRTFQHQDWVDGESVVQAEQTAGEDGFNLRFHRIEQDLDKLHDDMARAFACQTAMRASLRALLDEIRNELNRINSDVFQCCHVKTAPPPLPLPGNLGVLTAGTQFLGATKFFDKDVQVFQTNQGIFMLPVLTGPAVDPAVGGRLSRTGSLAAILTREDVRAAFPAAVTKEQLVDKFGDVVMTDGHKLSAAVDILPSGSKFANLPALLTAVTDAQAGAVRTGVDRSALAGSLGVPANAPLGDATVDQLPNLSPAAKKALSDAGIRTVTQVNAAKPEAIQRVLAGAGVTESQAVTASVKAIGSLLTTV